MRVFPRRQSLSEIPHYYLRTQGLCRDNNIYYSKKKNYQVVRVLLPNISLPTLIPTRTNASFRVRPRLKSTLFI
jgi:hypothetical protein